MSSPYNYSLVSLSVLIAICASFVAISLSGRILVAQGLRRRLWIVGGASAMGLGIFSMHYIGLLAFTLPDLGGVRPAGAVLVAGGRGLRLRRGAGGVERADAQRHAARGQQRGHGPRFLRRCTTWASTPCVCAPSMQSNRRCRGRVGRHPIVAVSLVALVPGVPLPGGHARDLAAQGRQRGGDGRGGRRHALRRHGRGDFRRRCPTPVDATWAVSVTSSPAMHRHHGASPSWCSVGASITSIVDRRFLAQSRELQSDRSAIPIALRSLPRRRVSDDDRRAAARLQRSVRANARLRLPRRVPRPKRCWPSTTSSRRDRDAFVTQLLAARAADRLREELRPPDGRADVGADQRHIARRAARRHRRSSKARSSTSPSASRPKRRCGTHARRPKPRTAPRASSSPT